MQLLTQILKPLYWIRFQYNSYVHNPLLFWSYKKKALNLHKITGYQFHVVPMSGNGMVIMSRNYAKPGECISLKAYNKAMKGRGKQLDIVDILKMAYYSTPQKR